MRFHQFTVLLVLAAAPLSTFSTPLAPTWDNLRVKHTWNTVPTNWETLGLPSTGTTIDLHFALRPHHENAVIEALHEISEPRSSKYRAHLSKEQVAQLVAPHPDTLELMYSWLGHHADELLGASYQLYRRTGTHDTILRTIGYALPEMLHSHVKTVVPTTFFASPRTLRQTPRKHSVRATADIASRGLVAITPADLRWLYKTRAYVPAAMNKNELGIAGYEDNTPSPVDLTMFMKRYRTDAVEPKPDYTVVHINDGVYDPDHPTAEANLNMQYAQAITYPTPHVFYSTGGGGEFIPESNEPADGDIWLEWLFYMLTDPNIPQTVGTTYGIREDYLPLEYAETVCDMFAELGALGVSVIFASGDHGVGEGECIFDDDSGMVQFSPVFPASCPWVTSVGGTMMYPEVGATISGGGFSNFFSRPDYQSAVVPAFLRHLDGEYDGWYNPAGRGIPDIAAQALNFVIVENKKPFAVDGTSCSAIVVAAIISLLNDYLLSVGEDPLGFLNPLLYGFGLEALTDITYGSNPGCGTEGFSATTGWDPVTGLGTPDFLKLRDILDLLRRLPGDGQQRNESNIL